MVYESKSPESTYELGVLLGKKAKAGQIYTLNGELGVGKTLFAQGFAKGLGVTDYVTSPTFTILQIYEGKQLFFYHFDVYRISDLSEMDEVGFEEYIHGDGVCLIEWADLIRDLLPKQRTEILIEKDLELGFEYRKITVLDFF